MPKVCRNKLRSRRARRSSKLGYLPVQSMLEGDEAASIATLVDVSGEMAAACGEAHSEQERREQQALKERLRCELQRQNEAKLQRLQGQLSGQRENERRASESPGRRVGHTEIYADGREG